MAEQPAVPEPAGLDPAAAGQLARVVRWRRWRRQQLAILGWGFVAALLALSYGLSELPQQWRTAQQTLGALLLLVGIPALLVGVVGSLVCTLVLVRFPRELRDAVKPFDSGSMSIRWRPRPVPGGAARLAVAADRSRPRLRLAALSWSVLAVLGAGLVALHMGAPAACVVGDGHQVTVTVTGKVSGRSGEHAKGEYEVDGVSYPTVVDDSNAPVGARVPACVGWVGYNHAWTGFPWAAVLIVILLLLPLAAGAVVGQVRFVRSVRAKLVARR